MKLKKHTKKYYFYWISDAEAASILSVSKRQLKYYRDLGYLPYSQIGRKIYYNIYDIDTFLKSNRVEK